MVVIGIRVLVLAGLVSMAMGGRCGLQEPEVELPEPTNVSDSPGSSSNPSLAVDSRGTVHLVWTDNSPGLEQGNRWNQEILYASKQSGEEWSNSVNISRNERASRFANLAVDHEDRLHLVWQDASPGQWSVFYAWKLPDSEWSVPETIAGSEAYVRPLISIDSALNRHVIWNVGLLEQRIWYSTRGPATAWSDAVPVLPEFHRLRHRAIACDRQGGVHVAWSGSVPGVPAQYYVRYGTLSQTGILPSWKRISVTGSVSTNNPTMVLDRQDKAHIVWSEQFENRRYPDLVYRVRRRDAVWSPAMQCTTLSLWGSVPALTLGTDERLHLVWSGKNSENERGLQLWYSSSSTAGPDWAESRQLATNESGRPVVGVSPQGEVHVAYGLCVDYLAGKYDIFHIQFEEEE